MEEQIFQIRTDLTALNEAVLAIRSEIKKVIVGQDDMVKLILAALLIPAIVFAHWRRKLLFPNVLKDGVYFLLPSLLIYFLSIIVYVNLYLPSLYKITDLLNTDLFDLGAFYNRITEMTGQFLLAGSVSTSCIAS